MAGSVEEVAKDDTDIVSALRAALADRVGRDRFELWFGVQTRMELEGTTLVLHAPNPLFARWIRANFREDLEAICAEHIGLRPEIDVRVAGSADAFPHSEGSANGRRGGLKPLPAASGPTVVAQSAPGTADAAPGVCRRKFADLESFVVGPSNRLAFASAEMAAQRPGQLSPLLFWGPTGVGKTHLLEGIWTAARKTHDRMTVVYLSAEQFVSGFVQALRGSGLPSFRQKYRGVDVLLLDDLQVLSGKRCTQVELQYTIDTLLREGRQVVLASDRLPSELPDLGPELIARLESGMVCRIEPPEHQTRRGIVAQMARRLAMDIPDDVQELIASRLTRHAREISGALCRLHAFSQAWQRPLTRATAEEVLADMLRAGARPLRLADIDRAVCATFGLEANSLQSNRKAASVSHPRMLAMWLARKYTRAALSEIGQYFGGRSHSTVVSAQKRVDRWLAAGAALRVADQTLAADEAIRQVEHALQAG